MTRQRRQLVLVAVLGVMIVWVGVGRLRDGSGSRPRRAAASGAASQELPEVARLRFRALQPQQGEFRPGRDIFRYGEVGPSPADLRREQLARLREQRPEPPPPPPAEPAEPQPPPVSLVLLGTFGPRDAPIAVFTDRDVIYNAREGDILEEQFIVRQIGYESVDLGFVGFPEDVTQRLGVGS